MIKVDYIKIRGVLKIRFIEANEKLKTQHT
jgi:hypothetical protein